MRKWLYFIILLCIIILNHPTIAYETYYIPDGDCTYSNCAHLSNTLYFFYWNASANRTPINVIVPFGIGWYRTDLIGSDEPPAYVFTDYNVTDSGIQEARIRISATRGDKISALDASTKTHARNVELELSIIYWNTTYWINRTTDYSGVMTYIGTQNFSSSSNWQQFAGSMNLTASDDKQFLIGFYPHWTGTSSNLLYANNSEWRVDYEGSTAPPAPGEPLVSGYVLNGYTGGAIATAMVNATQPPSWKNTTSDAGGAYTVGDFSVGNEILFYTTKTGYISTPIAFTPAESIAYSLNLIMLPTYIPNNTAIIGMAYTDWPPNPINGATVYISNSTWTGTSTTTNSAGYYIFDNLVGGELYTVNATATDHEQSIDYSVTTTSGETVQQDLVLPGEYTLTVYARDYSTGLLLNGVNVFIELSDEQVGNTSTGTKLFTVNSGLLTLTGTATGYTAGQTSVSVTGDSTATLLLYNSTASTGAGINYPPHQVRFAVKNQWGAPLNMIAVAAQGYETTAGGWDWLASLFGISLSSTPIHNASMAGNTGNDGSIVFMMIESVKYDMTLLNATQGVNETYTVYPKDDYYEIWVTTGESWYTGGYNALEEINISVATARKNATYAFINITYKDALNGTTGNTIFINQTNKTAVDLDEITIDSEAITTSDFNTSFLVPADDDSYFVTLGIQHSIFGTIVRTFAVIFEKAQVGIGLPSSWLIYIAVFFILFTGMFFGAVTSPTIGAITTCFVGWIMWGIGWLDDMGLAAPTTLVFATFISILSVIMVRSRKERYL